MTAISRLVFNVMYQLRFTCRQSVKLLFLVAVPYQNLDYYRRYFATVQQVTTVRWQEQQQKKDKNIPHCPNRPSTMAKKHGPIWVVCSCRRLWRVNSSKTSSTEQPKTLSLLSTHCPRLTAIMPISIKLMPSASSDISTKKPHRQPSR